MELTQFLDKLASKSPTPGGGGASALVGAIGIALGNMTGSLTVGKPKYASVEADIVEMNKRSEILRNELYELIERDAQAFMPVSKAYTISKDDPTRCKVMETALVGAAEVPLEIMRKCCEALEIIEEYAQKGSVIAISDAGCAASMCKAAIESAALNVFVNTKSMSDRKTADAMNCEVQKMLREYSNKAMGIYDAITGRLQ